MRLMIGGGIVAALMYTGVLQLHPWREVKCEAPPKTEGAFYQSEKFDLIWPQL